MRPILSATGTYNCKPSGSITEYTITDAFDFGDEIRNIPVYECDIRMRLSRILIGLIKPVPNLQRDQLVKLLETATTNQLFQFDSQFHEQTDGVAMGSTLGLILANVFMCHLTRNSHAFA